MKSDLLTAVVGILIFITIVSYTAFLISAKAHFESAAQREEALKQLDTLAFKRELRAKNR